MLLFEILYHVRQVVAALAETFLRTGLWLAPRIVDGKVGDVPVGDELTQRRDTRVFRELPKGIDGNEVRGPQRNINTTVLLVWQLAARGFALSLPGAPVLIIKEPKGFAFFPSAPLEPLFHDNWAF